MNHDPLLGSNKILVGIQRSREMYGFFNIFLILKNKKVENLSRVFLGNSQKSEKLIKFLLFMY